MGEGSTSHHGQPDAITGSHIIKSISLTYNTENTGTSLTEKINCRVVNEENEDKIAIHICTVEQKQSSFYGHDMVIQCMSPTDLSGMLCLSLSYLHISVIKVCLRGTQEILPSESCFESYEINFHMKQQG